MLIHPLVTHFPIALWLASTFFDWLAWWRHDAAYRRSAYWLVGLGLLGAAISIVLGWTDLLAQERQGVGTGVVIRHQTHSIVAYAATAAYAANFGWRRGSKNRVTPGLLALSCLGAILIAVTGYLGARLRDIM
jgi:uncharacterized membrane protein